MYNLLKPKISLLYNALVLSIRESRPMGLLFPMPLCHAVPFHVVCGVVSLVHICLSMLCLGKFIPVLHGVWNIDAPK